MKHGHAVEVIEVEHRSVAGAPSVTIRCDCGYATDQRDYAEHVLAAYLASPQAAEELARALLATFHERQGAATAKDEATAILAALRDQRGAS